MPPRIARGLSAALVMLLACVPCEIGRYADAPLLVSADELVDQADELEPAGLPFSAVMVVAPTSL